MPIYGHPTSVEKSFSCVRLQKHTTGSTSSTHARECRPARSNRRTAQQDCAETGIRLSFFGLACGIIWGGGLRYHKRTALGGDSFFCVKFDASNWARSICSNPRPGVKERDRERPRTSTMPARKRILGNTETFDKLEFCPYRPLITIRYAYASEPAIRADMEGSVPPGVCLPIDEVT